MHYLASRRSRSEPVWAALPHIALFARVFTPGRTTQDGSRSPCHSPVGRLPHHVRQEPNLSRIFLRPTDVQDIAKKACKLAFGLSPASKLGGSSLSCSNGGRLVRLQPVGAPACGGSAHLPTKPTLACGEGKRKERRSGPRSWRSELALLASGSAAPDGLKQCGGTHARSTYFRRKETRQPGSPTHALLLR